jgi:hypothetical protein
LTSHVITLSRPKSKYVFCPGADLHYADLRSQDLRNIDLTGANLTSANASRATLDNATLRDADFSRATLGKTSFLGADMRGAYLYNTYIANADFSGADLRGACIRTTDDARTALFTDTNLHGVKWYCGSDYVPFGWVTYTDMNDSNRPHILRRPFGFIARELSAHDVELARTLYDSHPELGIDQLRTLLSSLSHAS